MDSKDRNDTEIKQWQLKKTIKMLDELKGNGTSMISLIIPPSGQLPKINQMLTNELGTASNIKSRVNRQSVESAITWTQQKLKLYSKIPPNGLVIYCGTASDSLGKEKRISVSFEPHIPINASLYVCDNHFHTDSLRSILVDNEKFGFLIVDGDGALYGVLQGATKNILCKFSVDLPKKHNKGGQSSVRFARLREEAIHNYIRKVAETANKMYISGDKITVKSIIIAGNADMKTLLFQSGLLDYRLSKIVLKLIDVAYGGENGFQQAIEMSAEDLKNVRFVHEKNLLKTFFSDIALDTGKISFGVKETMKLLEMSVVDKMIVSENITYLRCTLKNKETNETKIIYVNNKDGIEKEINKDDKWIVEDNIDLLEWLNDNYKSFNITLHIVSDQTHEGAQFINGFGGVGAMLRYKPDYNLDDDYIDNNVDDDNDKLRTSYEAYEDDFI